MTPCDFVSQYERALATQQWSEVEPLIHSDACVTFSNGEVHEGKEAVRVAFEANFASIGDENYSISNVDWILRGENAATYLFDFAWTGRVDGREVSGSGRGTCGLVRDCDRWVMISEDLRSL